MVNVVIGCNQFMIYQIIEVLGDVLIIDCILINVWEDQDFVVVVKVIGRKKLIMVVLWIEVCLVYFVLDVFVDGFDVYLVVDVCGGILFEVYNVGFECLVQVGVRFMSWVQLICELQCDWNCEVIVFGFVDIFFVIEGY